MLLTRLVTVRSLSARRLRTILTVLGIVLGVASMFAIRATNQSAYASIERLFAGTAGQVDLEVRSAANVGGIPDDLLEDVLAQAGVAAAAPLLKMNVVLASDAPTSIDLSFFGAGGGGMLLHGIDPDVDQRLRDYTVVGGRFLTEDATAAELVLVEDYALDNGIAVGDRIDVLTAFGPVQLDVAGLIAKEGAGLSNLGKFGVVSLETAQRLTRRPGEIDQIDILVTDDMSAPGKLDDLRDSLQLAIGDAYAVVYPASQGDRMAQMLGGYQIGLNFMAAIALFVGAFLIYNALSMTIAERTREFGLLRSVGMSRSQITRQVLTEGAFLGLLGATLGAGLGVLMSSGLAHLMGGLLGQPIDVSGVPLGLLAGSMAVGIVVTLVAALLPAVQAGRISPMEAIRVRGRSAGGWFARYGWVAGLALLAMTAGLLVWNPFPYDVQFRLGTLTVFALFIGATLVIPVTLTAWHWLARVPFRLVFGPVGEIGTRNLERSKSRTMLTCAALLIGVSMIVVIQGMTASFSADLFDWMDAYIGGDAFVGSAVPLSLDVQAELESLPGISVAAPLRYAEVVWLPTPDGEEKITIMAVDPTSYTAVTRFAYSEPVVDDATAIEALRGGNAIFVSSVLSEKFGLVPGDVVRLKTKDGYVEFAVAAVVLDFLNQGMVITSTLADVARHFDLREASTFLIKAEDATPVADVVAEIKEAYGDKYKLIVESNAAIKERALALMDDAFRMFDVLGVIAVLVAALGVVNTLSMSVLERTREIGMLRSTGMTRSQVVRMILAEAGMLGLIGGVLGLGFGIALTRIFLAAMTAMSGYALDFVLPVRTFWWSVIVALATSQVAALLPALRAANTPMLAAIHYE